MLRARVSRRPAATAVALVAAAGIGLGAYSLGSASSGESAQIARAATAVPESRSASAAASPSAALTLEEAQEVAARAAGVPGRVVEWDADQEPTGLRYDVTLLHADGSTTDVEVDTVTGRVTSIDHDDDRD